MIGSDAAEEEEPLSFSMVEGCVCVRGRLLCSVADSVVQMGAERK